jgi:hypothetical protein
MPEGRQPTKAEVRAAQEVLQPPSAKDLAAVRERRYQVKDVLNTNLLGKEAREQYEKLYEDLGAALLKATGMTAEEAAKHGLE